MGRAPKESDADRSTKYGKPMNHVWHCDPNAIVCPAGHLWADYRSGYQSRWGQVAGHRFVGCRTCKPPIYFFVLYVSEPSFLAICHAISQEAYSEWNDRTRTGERTPPTLELLHLLRDPDGNSLNPNWKPG